MHKRISLMFDGAGNFLVFPLLPKSPGNRFFLVTINGDDNLPFFYNLLILFVGKPYSVILFFEGYLEILYVRSLVRQRDPEKW
jgi:hypothetical protein